MIAYAIERFFHMGKMIFQLQLLKHHSPFRFMTLLDFQFLLKWIHINVLGMLDKSNIPLLAKDREKPIVMAGGPAVTFNPEPLSPFIDFFVIGEGEEVIEEIIETYNDLKDLPKKEILEDSLKSKEYMFRVYTKYIMKIRRRKILRLKLLQFIQ